MNVIMLSLFAGMPNNLWQGTYAYRNRLYALQLLFCVNDCVFILNVWEFLLAGMEALRNGPAAFNIAASEQYKNIGEEEERS